MARTRFVDGKWVDPPQWDWFCQALLRLYAERGELSDEVLTEAVAQSYSVVDPKAQLRRAKGLLKLPAIQSRLGDLFEVVGLDLVEVLKLHVELVREKHWPAIAAYERMVLPQPAQRLDINQRTEHTLRRPQDAPPAMVPRALSAKVEKDESA